ncbi:MAG: OmpH family outer membrane protein [Arenicellales bacterium]|jgi:outer membrane protein|nr:OmpH family outer membrane protein [Arenicellales bacterium]|tara:strand:- start:434 stop:943 length:510 start_codon:yes stop_codon:yes gene_type:complete
MAARKIGISLILILAVTLGWPASAAEGTKIGIVNPGQLLERAPQNIASLKLLEDEFRPRHQALVGLRDRIVQLDGDLEKNVLVLQATEAEARRREIETLKRRLKREQTEYREDYNLRRNEELAKLQTLVRETIFQIAKEEGFDLILEQAVYVSDRINLTQKVLDRLNSN